MLWCVSLAALVGVWLNIKKHVACFYIWTCTNAVWTAVDAAHGIWPQAALQAVYFVLAVYGACKWRRERPGS